MPEVIVDTSPLQYLHQADHLTLLPQLYGTILVPRGVADEIATGLELGIALPILDTIDWLRVLPTPHLGVLPLAADLGRGEREVLSMALERPGALTIVDDRLARYFAKHLRIRHTGTLGVLLKAKEQGFLSEIRPILDRLQVLGFRLDARTRASVLELAQES